MTIPRITLQKPIILLLMHTSVGGKCPANFIWGNLGLKLQARIKWNLNYQPFNPSLQSTSKTKVPLINDAL